MGTGTVFPDTIRTECYERGEMKCKPQSEERVDDAKHLHICGHEDPCHCDEGKSDTVTSDVFRSLIYRRRSWCEYSTGQK